MLAYLYLGSNLRRLRHEAGESQTPVAKRAGISQTRYSQLERGLQPAGDAEVERLAAALGVTVAALLRRTRRTVGLARTYASTLPSDLGGAA
jgi:transcriptional regulator with XRE-family HTH domain